MRRSAEFARREGPRRRPRGDLGGARTAGGRRRGRPSRRGSTNHPKSFRGRQRLAARLVARTEMAGGQGSLARLRRHSIPEYVGAENRLRAAGRRLQAARRDAAEEQAVLEELAALRRRRRRRPTCGSWSWTRPPATGRRVVRERARLLAVNPLIPAPYRQLARAAEQLDRRDEAHRRVPGPRPARRDRPGRGALPPGQAARARPARPAEARREVLKSLEEAPRFLDAHGSCST